MVEEKVVKDKDELGGKSKRQVTTEEKGKIKLEMTE